MKVARLAGRAAGGSTGPGMCVPRIASTALTSRVARRALPPVMITVHVPAVRVPSGHAASRVAAAVPARGDVENHRDLDPAPPARGPEAAAAAAPEAELGRPGPARGTARRDTQSPPPRIAAAGHPGHDPALAPRHRPGPPGPPAQAREGRPARGTGGP